MREIGVDERRARLVSRHLLLKPATTVEDAAAALIGLHSSDPASVYLSAWARVKRFAVGGLEAALYDRRSLVRMLGMRRTMFVVPVDVAAIMDAACARSLAAKERRRLVGMLEQQAIAEDAATWLDHVEARTLSALKARGEATASQLSRDVPELAARLTVGEGRKWAGTMGVSTRVLFLLATEGRILRGRPLGSWTSTQYRWAPTETWLPGGLPRLESVPAREALLRRWLARFGPGTEADIRWWTGWAAVYARSALREIDAVEVGLDGTVGYVLSDDVDTRPAKGRRAVLLPSLDATVMGWKEREWYLGRHGGPLFDRNGNAGPTVWVDGRIVGGWGQRSDGRVATRLLEPVDSEAEGMVEVEASRLTDWLSGTRVTPRFRTPIETELAR